MRGVDPRFVKKTATLPSELPYLIKRTHVGNLPVYCETKKRADRTFGPVTEIGNIFGDMIRFQQDLRHAVMGEAKTQMKPRKLLLAGNCEDRVKHWLMKLGF